MDRRELIKGLGGAALTMALPGSASAATPAQDELYDSHAHLFTADFGRYPIDTRNAIESEDALRRRIVADPLTPERLLELWDANGIVGGAAVQYNTVYKTDNRFVLDSADRCPTRIAPVVILGASDPATPSTLEELITRRGIAGLRLTGQRDADGSYPWLDSPAALDTWKVADRHRLPMVLMYTPAATIAAALPRIGALAARFPSTPIILDHVGWPTHDAGVLGLTPALTDLRERRNIHYKLTTINFRAFAAAGIDATRFVRRAADIFGAHRLMWGSDVGNTPETYPEMARQARAAAALLDPAERRQFLSGTARSLFERRAGVAHAR